MREVDQILVPRTIVSGDSAPCKEEWFPDGAADEQSLRQRYKQLARKFHPDVAPPGSADQFKSLSAEYARLMKQCKTQRARAELQKAWLSIGGLAAAASVAFNDPTLAAILAGALGTYSGAWDLDHVVHNWRGGGGGGGSPGMPARLGAALSSVSVSVRVSLRPIADQLTSAWLSAARTGRRGWHQLVAGADIAAIASRVLPPPPTEGATARATAAAEAVRHAHS